MTYKFAIAKLNANHKAAILDVLTRAELLETLGSSVFLKPNFTYPSFKPGVTTTPEFITATVEVLKDLGCQRICLGEGDGGYNAFSMDETFKSYHLDELSKRYGIEVVNTSRLPSLTLDIESSHGEFKVNVPKSIFEEFDSFITLPVPKVHAMTTISNAVKNQWGLVQDVMRIHFHCAFNEIISEISQRLPHPIALVDGTYGLTENGPMIEGIPLDLGWVSACDNLWLNDKLMCDLMKINMKSVEHLMYAQKLGLMPDINTCVLDGNFEQYIDSRFYLKRNFWNYVAKSTWYSRRLNYLVYFSGFSSFIHKVMYSIRDKPKELSVKGVDWD